MLHWVLLMSSYWHREGALKVLAVPELSAPEIDSIKLDGSGYVLVYGIHGDFVQVNNGWVLSVTDEELLLSLAIPTLLKPSEYVIRAGGDIRIREEPSPNAPIAGIVKGAEHETLLEGYDKLGDYFRVFFNTCSNTLVMGWILSSLIEPFNGNMYRMNPNQCNVDGGITLMVHSVPDADAPCIERVGPEDEVCVVGSSGKWRRVLSRMGPMGWILSESATANGIFDELLVPICRDDVSTFHQEQSVQQSVSAEFPHQSVTSSQSQQPPSETIFNTTMEVVSTSKLRDEPAFVGLELAVLKKGTIVEIIEELDVPQKPGFPPQPWVRVRCTAGEGWTAKTNRNGGLLVPSSFSKSTDAFSRNSMQPQHCQQSDNSTRTSGTSVLPLQPVPIHSAEGSAPGSVPLSPLRFMEVCVTAKLREEADFIGLELAVLQKGDVVEVLDEREMPQKPGHPPQPWVNIRCAAGEGWIAKRNRNGPILVPTTHEIQAGKVSEKNQEACGQKNHDDFTRPQHIPSQLSSSPSTTPSIRSLSTHLSDNLSSKFMEVVSTAKLREDADFTGLELAVLGKGDIVEVLEEKDVPRRPGNPPQPWVRVRCGTGEGWTAKTNRNGALLIPTQKPTIQVPEQKTQSQMELNFQALDTSSSSQCSNSVHSPTTTAAALHVLPPAKATPSSCTFLDVAVTTIKLREKPDFAGVELAVLEKGGIVEVVERKDIPQKPGRPPQPWVKVKSSCGEGWTALTNQNGPLLVPTELYAVAVEQQKGKQQSGSDFQSLSGRAPLAEISIPHLNESLPSSHKEQKLQHLPAVSSTLLSTAFLAARYEEQVRQYPTSESPVVALMRAGTMARVMEDQPCGSWVKAELIGGKQPMVGWIDSQTAASSHPVSFKWIR